MEATSHAGALPCVCNLRPRSHASIYRKETRPEKAIKKTSLQIVVMKLMTNNNTQFRIRIVFCAWNWWYANIQINIQTAANVYSALPAGDIESVPKYGKPSKAIDVKAARAYWFWRVTALHNKIPINTVPIKIQGRKSENGDTVRSPYAPNTTWIAWPEYGILAIDHWMSWLVEGHQSSDIHGCIVISE